MERRTFLRGLLISATAGEALVKLASAEDINALIPHQPVLLGQPPPSDQLSSQYEKLFVNTDLYLKSGCEYHHIGYITSIRTHRPKMIEVTSCNDDTQQFVSGLGVNSYEGTFVGFGPPRQG